MRGHRRRGRARRAGCGPGGRPPPCRRARRAARRRAPRAPAAPARRVRPAEMPPRGPRKAQRGRGCLQSPVMVSHVRVWSGAVLTAPPRRARATSGGPWTAAGPAARSRAAASRRLWLGRGLRLLVHRWHFFPESRIARGGNRLVLEARIRAGALRRVGDAAGIAGRRVRSPSTWEDQPSCRSGFVSALRLAPCPLCCARALCSCRPPIALPPRRGAGLSSCRSRRGGEESVRHARCPN